MRQARQGQIARGEMQSDQPGAGQVPEVVQPVGISDAVDSGVDGEGKEDEISHVAKSGSTISYLIVKEQ